MILLLDIYHPRAYLKGWRNTLFNRLARNNYKDMLKCHWHDNTQIRVTCQSMGNATPITIKMYVWNALDLRIDSIFVNPTKLGVGCYFHKLIYGTTIIGIVQWPVSVYCTIQLAI